MLYKNNNLTNHMDTHLTFWFPDDADEPIIDVDILQAKSRPLPDPILLRRGNIQYILYAFINMSLNMI